MGKRRGAWLIPLALIWALGVAGAASAAEDAETPKKSLSLSDIAAFDPRQDLAYGAYQRGEYLTAFALALDRAKAGDAAAQTLIARIYDQGLGIKRDTKEAAMWYKLAADAGNNEARFAYAMKLVEGADVAPDRAEAKRLLAVAAQAGQSLAAYNLAQLLIEEDCNFRRLWRGAAFVRTIGRRRRRRRTICAGANLRQRPRCAARRCQSTGTYMEMAAKGGHSTAQVELAIWMANGRGGAKDEKTAFAWMQRAARAGQVIARNRLAKMLALGIGTPVR